MNKNTLIRLKGTKSKLLTKTRALYYAFSAFLLTAMASENVYAVDKNGATASNVKGIISQIVGLFPLIGIFFVVAGGLKLILAYRNDQPEAQTGAAKDIVIGLALIGFNALLWNKVLSKMI